MMRRNRRPTTPGEILREHYLIPRGISVAKFAGAVGCSRKHMSNIVNGRAQVEAGMAVRMSKILGTTPEFWLNLQTAVSLYDAAKALENWRPDTIVGQVQAKPS